MNIQQLDDYLKTLLKIDEIKDDSLNGVQVSNRGEIGKIALAVDTSLETIEKAVEENANCLFVHHGLFWGQPVRIVEIMYERIRLLIQSNMALYAVHLPLDLHPELGNNAQIASMMEWTVTGTFGDYHGTPVGVEVHLQSQATLSEIVSNLKNNLTSDLLVWDFGKKEIQKIGIVSGGALSILDEAVQKDIDLFITGEPKHTSYWQAKESGINVVFGGHYATETLGVKAVGKHLSEKFGIESVFIDLPTGL